MLQQFRTFPTSPSDEQLANAIKGVSYTRIDNWLDTDFATAAWWGEIAITILTLFLWWKLVDKKRLIDITLYGFLVMATSLTLDQIGYELGFWYYPVDLIPLFPPATAVDFIALPVIYSLIFQYCRHWKPFLAATLLMSTVFCFFLEPLMVKMGYYVLIKWRYYYGFPIYTVMAVVFKALLDKMKAITSAS
ncbi:MAG: hypothetical protein P4N41_24525 [Negativicutes bacterium]|nr:hypothetical protein [Negativicutes bacterium]MDR3592837.1 hypothetical protein [Negativicutes bacterium]